MKRVKHNLNTHSIFREGHYKRVAVYSPVQESVIGLSSFVVKVSESRAMAEFRKKVSEGIHPKVSADILRCLFCLLPKSVSAVHFHIEVQGESFKKDTVPPSVNSLTFYCQVQGEGNILLPKTVRGVGFFTSVQGYFLKRFPDSLYYVHFHTQVPADIRECFPEVRVVGFHTEVKDGILGKLPEKFSQVDFYIQVRGEELELLSEFVKHVVFNASVQGVALQSLPDTVTDVSFNTEVKAEMLTPLRESVTVHFHKQVKAEMLPDPRLPKFATVYFHTEVKADILRILPDSVSQVCFYIQVRGEELERFENILNGKGIQYAFLGRGLGNGSCSLL